MGLVIRRRRFAAHRRHGSLQSYGSARHRRSAFHRYKGLFLLGEIAVPTSVLEAIKLGLWDFEPPDETLQDHFRATHAMPGTPDKLDVLAERVRLGQPLWHPADRQDYDDPTDPSAN